jgi:hypothetical protein
MRGCGQDSEGLWWEQNRNSAVGVVTMLWAGRLRNLWFDLRQTGSEAHLIFYSMGAGGS